MSLRVLIFGTCYAPTDDKVSELRRWIAVNARLNPVGCDLLLVDSNSLEEDHDRALNPLVGIVRFPDNIGHLARGGRDGWGRAFCFGLQYALDRGYDYVVHVEGDSLFRLPVMPIIEDMVERGVGVASVPVRGTRMVERNWVETGLMLFDVAWLRSSKLVERYDWPEGAAKAYPHTPEWHLYQLTLPALRMMPWSAERGDQGQIRSDNVGNYDWITHVEPRVADEFVRQVLG